MYSCSNGYDVLNLVNLALKGVKAIEFECQIFVGDNTSQDSYIYYFNDFITSFYKKKYDAFRLGKTFFNLIIL